MPVPAPQSTKDAFGGPPVVPQAVSRPEGMPVPNWLNFGLVVAVCAVAATLLWLGALASAWYIVLLLGIVFSYVLLTNYALLHEATHFNLNSNLTVNYWLGLWTGILFPVPFTMIRLTHQGHHDRNRTDAEMFDLYYPTDNWLYKSWIWYGTLSGWFWPLVPFGAVLLALLPHPLYRRLFPGPPWRNPSLQRLTPRELWQIRFELLVIVAVWTALLLILRLPWFVPVAFYALFSFNWSTRQYVAHAFSKRDIIEGAWNLKHNGLMTMILLNGTWDLNHHRRPDVSWYYLPRLSPEGEERRSYFKQYWRQWAGPRLTTEPSPEPLGEAS